MDKSQNKMVRVSRKDRRKAERKLKKTRKSNYFIQKKSTFKDKTNEIEKKPSNKAGENCNFSGKIEKVSQRTHLFDSLQEQMKNQRKRRLVEDNKGEEKLIKKLEKKLKLDKRFSKTMPKYFLESGLDYILDVCDSDRVKDAVNEEGVLFGFDSDFSDDFGTTTLVKDPQKSVKNQRKRKDENNSSAFEDTSSLVSQDEEENIESNGHTRDPISTDQLEDIMDLNYKLKRKMNRIGCKKVNKNRLEDKNINQIMSNRNTEEIVHGRINEGSKKENNINSNDDDCWEDIYGRSRDKKGRIIQNNSVKYIPPQLRETFSVTKNVELEKLKRELKGFLNKLTTSNLKSISLNIEDLYSKHSRNSVSSTLFELYFDAIVLPVLCKENLIIDHAMLIAVLHANVGSEIGAFFLTGFVEKFNKMYSPEMPVENKELDNLLLLICHLFNFRIFESCLIYDLLKKISSNFREKDVDLVLVVLKSVGFLLRKDDPISLKDFIIEVQRIAHNVSIEEENARMKFMIDILMGIKNNNISKVIGYNPYENERLRKVIRFCIRKGNVVTQLNIGLEDILKAEERGRWWIVGSSWSGKEVRKEDDRTDFDILQNKYSSVILDLAKRQNMNTENRKNIFCILMTSDDPSDAFERLLRLGLKSVQEYEISQIIMHCLLQEKVFNKYYFHVSDQLCAVNRKHQFSFQRAFWDKFKILSSLSNNQVSILAKFLSSLILSGSIPLTVFKTVKFEELNKRSIRFLRQTFLFMFSNGNEEVLGQVFEKVKNKNQGLLRESLRLFLNHFILKYIPDSEVRVRIEMIDALLTELIL